MASDRGSPDGPCLRCLAEQTCLSQLSLTEEGRGEGNFSSLLTSGGFREKMLESPGSESPRTCETGRFLADCAKRAVRLERRLQMNKLLVYAIASGANQTNRAFPQEGSTAAP
jgi:hypothetical protein